MRTSTPSNVAWTLASAGSYVKPAMLTISADVAITAGNAGVRQGASDLDAGCVKERR